MRLRSHAYWKQGKIIWRLSLLQKAYDKIRAMIPSGQYFVEKSHISGE